MSLKNNSKKDEKKEKNENEIEIVMGDNSSLEISGVGDYMNTLKPKDTEKNRKPIVIPKVNKKK